MLGLDPDAARALEARLRDEVVVWITTVRGDGQPQSSPVWFVWDGEEFLVFAEPGSPKVSNVRVNPLVSLHLNSDREGGEVATFEGAARIEDGAPAPHRVSAYLEKYGEGIAGLDMTPEEFGLDYSTPIRIRPSRVRVY